VNTVFTRWQARIDHSYTKGYTEGYSVAQLSNFGEVLVAQRKKLVPVRILIVDDHDVVREGVRSILKKRSDWEVIGEASNGQEALAQTEALRPDVIILDITMPQMSGLDVARKITQSTPDSRVVMFTMHDSGTVEHAVKGSGAHGIVLKLNAARDLVKAVDTVAGGGTFFGAAISASNQ
jgi:two-component system nitrate/nitrite response regulator NarL